MPDAKEIQNFLDKESYAPGVLSSNCILDCALRNGKLRKGGTTDRLIGETFFRHWLFKGQLPDPLKELFEHEELEEERTLFLEQKWEEQNELSPSFSYLKDRIDTFEKAEGIIALVNTEDKEALPIPFTFGSSQSRPGVWDESSQNPQEIGAWSEYQEEIDSLLGSGITSVKLNVPLGPFAQLIEGRSLMLALALAIARREDPTLPPPLEVLATGSIISGKIGLVEHMDEKMMLAKRMQARIVAVLKDPPTHSFPSSENENLSDFLGRWQARFGKVLPAMLESHFESWRTHINNFKGRDKLVNQILGRLKDKEKGGHVALIMPEGMGKSALLTHVSNVLSKEARKSGRYQGSREICPWLPGCLLHMGKFGSEPHRLVESLLTQANSMLTNPVSIPDEPVSEAPKRLDIKEGSNPESPDYREIYRTHREALSQALGKLIEEKKQIFLLIDALDEITVDKGFLCIFPDPFPVGVRVMITGRNCQQVDSFMDRREGFEKMEAPALLREEISPITGVSDEIEEGETFNNKVFRKTGGWAYSVNEIGRRISQENGHFSVEMILNREETLTRIAGLWEGALLEDALKFLVLNERFIYHGYGQEVTDEIGDPKKDHGSGETRSTLLDDLESFLYWCGHLNERLSLREALRPVQEQLLFHERTINAYNKKGKRVDFALIIMPRFCLENVISEKSIDLFLQRVCKWIGEEKNPDLIWRLNWCLWEEGIERVTSFAKFPMSKKQVQCCRDTWTQIKKTWSVEELFSLVGHYRLGCGPSRIEHEAIQAAVDLDYDPAYLMAAREALSLGFPDPGLTHFECHPKIAFEYLRRATEAKDQESSKNSRFLLGCLMLKIDGYYTVPRYLEW